jgi:hypothetical protein
LSSITERRREEAAMSVWSSRFLKSAIVQGSIVTGLAIIFVLGQMLYSSSALNIIQFLSLSFEGPAKWLFLGYILYIILAVAIATTALFYNHFEVNMHNGIRKYRSLFAWVHLIGMENIFERLENAPKAFVSLFKGESIGRKLVKLDTYADS